MAKKTDVLAERVGESISKTTKSGAPRQLEFKDLKTYDWEVKSIVETEQRKVRDEEDGTFVLKTKVRRKCTGLDLQMFRTETDRDTGSPTRKEYRHILHLPFFTFDNSFISQGFTTEQVAEAVWTHTAFGRAVEIIPVSRDEKDEHYQSKSSPDILAIHDRMRLFTPEMYADLAHDNDVLLSTPVERMSAVIPGMPYEIPA